jgi:heptosyltransferase I
VKPRDCSGLIDTVASIRIVLLTGLGDVVHGLPIVNALRRRRPDLHVTWVVEPMPAGLLDPHPAIDRVVVFHRRAGLDGVLELHRRLAAAPADLTINLNVYFKSIFATLFNRSPVRLGFDRGRTRDGVSLACNAHLPERPRRHTQDMFLEFLEILGVATEPLEWRLEPTRQEQQQQAAFVDSLDGQPMAAIVTASANPKKDWVADRWVELAERLYADAGLRPVLIGGPGPRESAIALSIIDRARAPVIDARGDGVRRLVWLILASRLVIAPDTGPVHIARALDVPVIGLYGHTNPWRVGPYGRYHDLWIDRYTEPGQPPDASAFDPKHGRMEQITTDEVMAKVRSALELHPARVTRP